MRIKEVFYLTIFLLLINACKPAPSKLYSFDPRSIKTNNITLSDFAEDILYLPIPNNFPVGKIDLFKYINQSIYIYSTEGIIRLDLMNNEIWKIGHKGIGPGEYFFGKIFTVDEETGTVYVLDHGSILKSYSKSGKFLRSLPFQKLGSPASIDFLGSNMFVSYAIQFENAKYSWIVFDTTGKIIKQKKSGIPIFNSDYTNAQVTYKLKNKIYYYNEYADTVFSVLPDLSEKPSFLINPGEHRFPKSRDVPNNPFERYMVISSIFETNQFIFFRYYYKNPTLLLFDKRNTKSYKIDLKIDKDKFILLNGIENDLDGGLAFIPEHYAIQNNIEYIIGIVDPSQIKKHIESIGFKNSSPKYPVKKKEFEYFANKVNETDNPVFVMVKLKK
ncbi:MAG TPA: 6-bladed beta-propeller [Bacteroidales bacterium]|nr:6-bladed beta-propeller [Bacteroidales bacterium]